MGGLKGMGCGRMGGRAFLGRRGNCPRIPDSKGDKE